VKLINFKNSIVLSYFAWGVRLRRVHSIRWRLQPVNNLICF